MFKKIDQAKIGQIRDFIPFAKKQSLCVGAKCDIFTFKMIEVFNRACQNENKDSSRIHAAFRTKLQAAMFNFRFSFKIGNF